MPTKRTDAILTTGVLLLGLGFVLQVVGVATPSWRSYGGTKTFGLFESCVNDERSEHAETFGFLKVIQAFSVGGALLEGIALLKSIIFCLMVYKGKTGHWKLAMFSGVEALLAALLIFVGVVLFIFYLLFVNYPGYSFYLCAVASGLTGLGGISVLIGRARIIASAAPQPGLVITPGGPSMAVAYQVSSGAIYAPDYQHTESSLMQQNQGSMYPTPQILPQQHAACPPPQYAAYPPPQYAAYPPQQFPSPGNLTQPTNQPPATEKKDLTV